jgi:hypothetical protein
MFASIFAWTLLTNVLLRPAIVTGRNQAGPPPNNDQN